MKALFIGGSHDKTIMDVRHNRVSFPVLTSPPESVFNDAPLDRVMFKQQTYKKICTVNGLAVFVPEDLTGAELMEKLVTCYAESCS